MTRRRRWIWPDLAWALALGATVATVIYRGWVLGAGEPLSFALGPLRVSSFGILGVLDILFGLYLIWRWCDRFDLDGATLSEGLPWIVSLGLVASHLVSIALYYPRDLTDLGALLDLRQGISSFGGLLGGTAVALVFFRRRGLPAWRYSDPILVGFTGGYVFGRAGCFSVHDHPGVRTDFLLGVEIGGVVRHDLGFYEMLLMLAMLVAMLLMARRGRPPDGAVVALFALVYAPSRFFLDSLRVGDARYAGLTPGQWFCLPLAALGLWAAWRLRLSRR